MTSRPAQWPRILAATLAGIALGWFARESFEPAGPLLDVVIEDNEMLSSLCPKGEIVFGNLTVAGPEITDLSPLECLREVRGRLSIRDTEALQQVRLPHLSIAGSLILSDNPMLLSLDLPGLNRIEEVLRLHPNKQLREVNLPLLEEVGDSISIEGNPALPSLSLPHLRSAEGGLSVDSNKTLRSLDLPSLESVGEFLDLQANPAIEGLDLLALREVRGDLELRENQRLITLRAPLLREVGGPIWLYDNPALTEVMLPQLETIGDGMELRKNPLLQSMQLGPETKLSGTLKTGKQGAGEALLTALMSRWPQP